MTTLLDVWYFVASPAGTLLILVAVVNALRAKTSDGAARLLDQAPLMLAVAALGLLTGRLVSGDEPLRVSDVALTTFGFGMGGAALSAVGDRLLTALRTPSAALGLATAAVAPLLAGLVEWAPK